ncbi:MAG: TonB-dependent receptor [Ruminobacter sp.]|nr:TonB-dependent receptor [Ruminobacter sp.]
MYKEMKKNGMLLTALASSIALATSAAAEEEYDFNLDTISVSANKYSQDMVSLSGQAEVADEKTLDKNEIRGVKDISKVVSAVTPAVGFGSRQLTKYTIRGVNSGNIYNSGVAVYVDGIAQPFSQMNQQFNDVGSVEVLKGPQGTIYGEGAQVGIINVTTKNPMFDGNYAEVETDYSKLYWKNKLDAGGALYEDTVYGKIGIVSQKEYGWIKDLDGSNYNTGESYGVNGALYFNGGEKVPLTVTLGGSYNKDRGHQSNVALTESEYRDGKLSGHGINRNPDFTRSYIAGMMAADPGVAAYFGGYEEAYTALYNSGAIKDEIDPVEHRNAYTAYVKLDYYRDNGDTINSVTSVNRSDSCELYMMGQGRCGNNNIQTRQFSQEVRYVAELGQSGSRSDSGKAVIGVNATKTTTDNFVLAQVDVSDNEMYQALLGGSQYVPIGQVDLRADDLSVSWFGDLVYNFGVGDESVFDIDLGARYEHDLSKANGTYNFNSKMDRVAKDDDLIDYKVAFGFSYVPGQRVYVLSSSGSKAGGFSKFPTSDLDDKGYDAEKTYNYELGYHMSYDNGFDANMALFYMDVHDRQAYTVVENSYMTPLRNIGQMHSAGAELTMGYRSERAVAGISMTYADAKNETSGYTKHPSNAPKFVTAALVDVTAFKGDGFAWHIGGNGRYQSKTYFGEGYTDMFAANNLKQEYQGGYSLFDFYTSAELIKNIEIKAYVENVFDKKYSNSIDNGSNFGVRFHSMAAPRNVGLKLKYSF